jgi:hypothetical protein
MQNPNRFIRGLSDLSEIVDPRPASFPLRPILDEVEVIFEPGNSPIVVPIEGGNFGSGGSNPLESTVFETTLTSDGPQTFTLNSNPGSVYTLFINGLRQSKTAYTISETTLSLPLSLNLFAGDVISLEYITN